MGGFFARGRTAWKDFSYFFLGLGVGGGFCVVFVLFFWFDESGGMGSCEVGREAPKKHIMEIDTIFQYMKIIIYIYIYLYVKKSIIGACSF